MQKAEILEVLRESAQATQTFVNQHGGSNMPVEARIKLLENQVQDLFWLVAALTENNHRHEL